MCDTNYIGQTYMTTLQSVIYDIIENKETEVTVHYSTYDERYNVLPDEKSAHIMDTLEFTKSGAFNVGDVISDTTDDIDSDDVYEIHLHNGEQGGDFNTYVAVTSEGVFRGTIDDDQLYALNPLK